MSAREKITCKCVPDPMCTKSKALLFIKHAPVVDAYPGIPRIPTAVGKEVWILGSNLRTSGLVLPSEIVSVLQPNMLITKSPTEKSLFLLSITLSKGRTQYIGHCIQLYTLRLVYLATCDPSIVLPRGSLALYGLRGQEFMNLLLSKVN